MARLNEKKAILRQKTSDETIIANAANTAFNQEDLADLLDKGASVIYLCGEKFNIPARVGDKKYIGVLGTPKVAIKANAEELEAKGIVFENVTLPWRKSNKIAKEKEIMEASPITSRFDWTVPFEKLHKVVMASFAKEKAFKKEELKETSSTAPDLLGFVNAIHRMTREEEYKNYNTDKDKIWTVVGESQSIEIDKAQKEIALSVVCGGEYNIDDIVYIRVTEDLSAGWAFTKDSFCAVYESEPIVIPYKSIKVKKSSGIYNYGQEGYSFELQNTSTKQEWRLYTILEPDMDDEFEAGDFELIDDEETGAALVKCLNTMRNLFKK